MLFNSISYLIFLPVAVLLYYLIPKRARYIWLLFCSYFFYLCADFELPIYLIICTITTYIAGLLLGPESFVKVKHRKYVAGAAVLINIGILGVLKYLDYVLNLFGTGKQLNLIVPIGISFFTLQSVSYVFDCYRDDVYPEKNIFKYALFVSFFPCIMSGPILKAKEVFGKVRFDNDPSVQKVKEGLLMMLWGYFLKIVISARLTIWIDTVYGDSASYNGAVLFITAIIYVFLVYADFEGYSMLALGSAKMLGIDLPINFKRPLLATNFSEFWKRWHIALSSWLKEYLYIPLGGSRKGKRRQYINLMIVMFMSGLWHGANETFMIWGLLNGVYQVVGAATLSKRKELWKSVGFDRHTGLHRVLQIITVVGLYAFSFVFFAADSVSDAMNVLSGTVTRFTLAPSAFAQLTNVGLGVNNLMFVTAALVILIAVDLICEKKSTDICGLIKVTPTVIRWGFYWGLLIMILFSASLNMTEFIYAGM